jgi:hypothetical protein
VPTARPGRVRVSASRLLQAHLGAARDILAEAAGHEAGEEGRRPRVDLAAEARGQLLRNQPLRRAVDGHGFALVALLLDHLGCQRVFDMHRAVLLGLLVVETARSDRQALEGAACSDSTMRLCETDAGDWRCSARFAPKQAGGQAGKGAIPKSSISFISLL